MYNLFACHSLWPEVCFAWAALRHKWPRCNDSLLAKRSNLSIYRLKCIL